MQQTTKKKSFLMKAGGANPKITLDPEAALICATIYSLKVHIVREKKDLGIRGLDSCALTFSL